MTTPTKDPTDMGMNRTGIQTSPVLSKELIEAARASVPSSPGGSEGIAQVRAEYARESGPMGTMPPPTKLKGIATSAMTAMKGEKPTVLLDKIGARLAFERT
ncbi:MAG TPA: ferritin-like domain-containing protein, partial [Myxococcaceae bacterium]|nr:ferritin-like domain-containing protein [Myxococcaceae bacterium]